MRRSLLVTLMALGTVVSLLSATGVLAVFSDTAETPDNSLSSGAQPSSADIRVAVETVTGEGCGNDLGTFDEDFVSLFFNAVGLQPNSGTSQHLFCIGNAGARSVSLTASTFDVVDLDTDCTGDELAVDPSSCGLSAEGNPLEGELSPLVTQRFYQADCAGSIFPESGVGTVAAMAATPVNLPLLDVDLGPGQIACFVVELGYNPSEADALIAQTDRVTWKLRFTGTTA